MFDNKKIFVLGLARSGYAIAKFLIQKTNQMVVNDFSDNDAEYIDELTNLGITVVTGSHPDELFDESFDYLIKNPGIKNDHQYVLKAKKFNIPVINELEAIYLLLPQGVKIIGITGSNGKTTTTTLIYEILKKAYNNVVLAGNIGIPLANVYDQINKDTYLILEISDHQLANIDNFKTDISVLTNLNKTHIDFWGSFEDYKKAKKKIFNHHTNKSIAILNNDNDESIKLTKDIKSQKRYFSTKNKADCYLLDDNIYYQDKLVISTKDIFLRGMHNYENIMAAIIVSKELKIDENIIKTVLEDFKGIEHRIEYVKKVNDRTFYNDSKSTNNTATMTALKTFHEPIVLILGGLNRDQDFKELAPYLNKVRSVVCYGENKLSIEKAMLELKVPVKVVDNLPEAVHLAYEISEKGDIILFSPASASWDQFKDFEVRGTFFKEIVNDLK